jgi:hypothetical protein
MQPLARLEKTCSTRAMSISAARSAFATALRAACVRPVQDNRSNNNRRLHKGAGA